MGFSELSLNGSWRFKGFAQRNGEELGAYRVEFDDADWLFGSVPGTVHLDLMINKLIEDPFKDLNEPKVQWVAEDEWWYRREIQLTPEILQHQVVELVFEGLDTVASVWVNGVLVGEANNMFTPWRFNIKNAAKPGKNLIAVRFKPIYKVAYELEEKYRQKYACLCTEYCTARPYVRKAQYSFGWDWGPTLPTAGIWRETKIVAYDTAKLNYFAALPIEVSKAKAKVKLTATLYAPKNGVLRAKFALCGFGQKLEREVKTKVHEGRSFVECVFDVLEPQLWWPRGYGEPCLYDASVQLFCDGEVLDEAACKVGVRSVELLQSRREGTRLSLK